MSFPIVRWFKAHMVPLTNCAAFAPSQANCFAVRAVSSKVFSPWAEYRILIRVKGDFFAERYTDKSLTAGDRHA
jgi:hypothetical protein